MKNLLGFKMDFNFFVELTGESPKNRVRTNKLIKSINELKENELENTRVIISGKSSFNFFHYDKEGHKEIKKIILEKTKLKETQLISEMESMDTYGNIYFSIRVLIKEIYKLRKQNLDFEKININIVTEKFHNKRVRIILSHFQKIFYPFLFNYKIQTNLISSENGINFFREIEYKITSLTNILDGFILIVENIFELKKIEKYELFELYLFSLPPYSLFYELQTEDKEILKIHKEHFLNHNFYKKLIVFVKKKFNYKEKNKLKKDTLKNLEEKIFKEKKLTRYSLLPLKKLLENPEKDFKVALEK